MLLEQAFVIDTDIKVKDAIDRVAEELGSSVAVTDFVRFALGEGAGERADAISAAEVAAAGRAM